MTSSSVCTCCQVTPGFSCANGKKPPYVPNVFFGLTGPVWRPKLGVVRCGVKCRGHHADNLVGFAIQGDAPPDHSRIRAKAIDSLRVTDYDHVRRAGFIAGGFERASEMRGRSKSLEELVINLLRGDQFGRLSSVRSMGRQRYKRCCFQSCGFARQS
jgi:hypothetical protein